MRNNITTHTAGVSTLEYGILAGMIGLALVGILHTYAGHLTTLFSHVGRAI